MPPARILQVLSILALLLPLAAGEAPGAGRADGGSAPATVPIYLADAGMLSPTAPQVEGSAPFDARVGGPLVWLVGTWSTPPLSMAVDYSGNINFSVWARASGGVQMNTRFQVYFGVNGQRGDTAYNTGSDRLGSSPTEFKGTAPNVGLRADRGDQITYMVYVSERGSGGEVVWGASYPSRIELRLAPLSLNLSHEGAPGTLEITGRLESLWGEKDLREIELLVAGPFGGSPDTSGNLTRVIRTVRLEALDVETVGNETVFRFGWKYDPVYIAEGNYIAAVRVMTLSNFTAYAALTVYLRPTGSAALLSGPAAIAVAAVVVAALAGGAVYYFMRRSGRGVGALFRGRKAGVPVNDGQAPPAGTGQPAGPGPSAP